MKTFLAAVVWVSFAGVLTASPPMPQRHQQASVQAQLPSEFMGEPDTIQRMRIGDTHWVPAHGLVVDKNGKCWIDKDQKLDETSLHVIQVHRFHDKGKTNRVLYGVTIEKNKLQGWMWRLGKYEGTYYEATSYAPVSTLDVSE